MKGNNIFKQVCHPKNKPTFSSNTSSPLILQVFQVFHSLAAKFPYENSLFKHPKLANIP